MAPSKPMTPSSAACAPGTAARQASGTRLPSCLEADDFGHFAQLCYFAAWRREGQEFPRLLAFSRGADGVRASKAHHAVERLDRDLGFDLLGRPGLGVQGVADHAFKSAHGRLNLSPLSVAGAFLPAH